MTHSKLVNSGQCAKMDVSTAVFSLENLSKDKHLPASVEVIGGVPADGGDFKVCRGDVLQILELTNIAKVTAEFTDDITIANRIYKPDSFQLTIPLDSTERLKIVNEIKSYQLVSQIFEDMPRFVRIKEKLIVPNGMNGLMTELEAGSVIEVVSRHHGRQCGFRREMDELKVRCEQMGFQTEVNVLVNTRGEFRSDPDTTLYTVRGAVERYPLPAVAAFQDDLLHRLFEEMFPHNIKAGFSAPETVRLLKTVTHETYVCRLEQRNDQQSPADPSSDVLLLNASTPEVRNIRVRVLDAETAARPDYEIPVMKKTTLENAMRQPELVQNSDTDDEYEEVFPEDKIKQELQPPKRSTDVHGEHVKVKSSSTSAVGSTCTSRKAAARSQSQRESPSVLAASSKAAARSQSQRESPSVLAAGMSKIKGLFRRKPAERSDSEPTSPVTSDDVPEMLTETQQASDAGPRKLARVYSVFPSRGPSGETSTNIYDDLNELEMNDDITMVHTHESDKDYITPVAKLKPLVYKKPQPKPTDTPETGVVEESDVQQTIVEDLRDNDRSVTNAKTEFKPHQPNRNDTVHDIKFDSENLKSFQKLTVEELCQRLIYCRLEKLATVAKLQSLDGWGFSQIEKEVLRAEPFNLSNIELMKFEKVKDGWVPKL